MSGDTAEVLCPWCYEAISIWIDPESVGRFVEDCEVCCRPWAVHVVRDALTGEVQVAIARAQ